MDSKRISMISLSTALIIICSWICIPFTVPFTLQSFAIFYTLLILGSKDGIISIVLYILIGILGLPVFSNFQGGIGHLFGPTGGYIFGFIILGLICLLFEKIFNNSFKACVLGMIIGNLLCYIIGALWFYIFFNYSMNFITILSICIVPYIIPDFIKIMLAIFLFRKTKNILK